MRRAIGLLVLLALLPQSAPAQPAPRDGQRDFDWEIGTWRSDLRLLQNPLTGSDTWSEYTGTTVVREVWGGRANLVEFDVAGPAGNLVLASLRLYNPETREWSLHAASARSGSLFPPVVGRFDGDGRGEFFGEEEMDGRRIRVRFVITPVDPDTYRFEQAFSADDGATWEVNWIVTDTRVPEAP